MLLTSRHTCRLIQRIKNSEFARHVGTLATGSLLAQVIGIVAAPILTRIYGPASYAAVALFSAIVSSIAPAASGQYDVSIVVAKDEQDSKGLLILSLWVAVVVSLLMLLVLLLGHDPLMAFLKAESLGFWFILTPLSLFLSAVVSSFKYYANRRKSYKSISRIQVVQAIFSVALSMSLGKAGFESYGLLITSVIVSVFGSALLLYSFRQEIHSLRWQPTSMTWSLAKKYKRFPIYNALPSLLDSLTVALPVFFLTKYFPVVIVGYYALLTRVASAPLGFIAQAVSQVHIRAVAEHVHNKQDPTKYLLSLSFVLLGIVALPTLALVLYAPTLFVWVFGVQWRLAGELLAILMPSLALRFVVSTVSGVFSSTGNNHLAAFWKIFAFLGTFLMFWRFADQLTVKDLFLSMMVLDFVLYSFYYYLIWYAIKHPLEFK